MDIHALLTENRDDAYALFQSRLTPTVAPERFIGVRVPVLRDIAKRLTREGGYEGFLTALPHAYYDENMLHGLLISEMKDYASCVDAVERFLPYVDNWAVCDILSPKVFRKHRAELIGRVRAWIASPETYTCRFGVDMLMAHYLDGDFRPEYLQLAASADSDEYYVKMAVAWYFATALAKQWDTAVGYLERNALPVWTHNKTIRKACESFRITDEQKAYLKTLKR